MAFNVYLPPSWTKHNSHKYPLVILLHGQGEDENTFKGALPKDSLNSWIERGFISEAVFIALQLTLSTSNFVLILGIKAIEINKN